MVIIGFYYNHPSTFYYNIRWRLLLVLEVHGGRKVLYVTYTNFD
jgi:hypothetical protein